MKVLVINCGSSSLKYQLINMENESVLAIGLCERIGIEGSRIKYTPEGGEKVTLEMTMNDHEDAFKAVIGALTNEDYGVIKSLDEINAIGHRVVHGGEIFSGSVVITDEVKDAIRECISLAPLHNPANLMGIEVCERLMPGKPMVGVFDTAFHQTLPAKAYLYAIPYAMYEKHKIRRYGFHGTSHKYVANRTAEFLGKNIEDLKIISCHLGAGASLCAVDGGKSVDTSMGFTPLAGLVMGTRSGDIDPAIVTFLMEKEGLTTKEVDNLLNKKSGVLGLTEKSSDFFDLEMAMKDGDERAITTGDVYAYRVAKYIGEYAAAMNGVDAILFTAGVGENDANMRAKICEYVNYLGANLDAEKNNVRGKETIISTDDSKVKLLVMPTNEELMIARDTKALV
ncbi:MAG: acetate kinase [Clostridia bacterium]|jgi:acetate kinase|nr:acetate kinase [Clostridia bacterium]